MPVNPRQGILNSLGNGLRNSSSINLNFNPAEIIAFTTPQTELSRAKPPVVLPPHMQRQVDKNQ